MKLTYLCHACFMLEHGGLTVLIDPFFTDERKVLSAFPQVKNPDFILVSHGHEDHVGGVFSIAGTKTVVVGMVELCSLLQKRGFKTLGMNLGGTALLAPDLSVTLVKAEHSSSFQGVYTGEPSGFILRFGGKTIYFSGDTAVFGDMKLIDELYRPNIGLLCVGGHYTADVQAMAYACNRFFHFDLVVPMHYNTFPAIQTDVTKLPPLLERSEVALLSPLESLET